MAYSTEISPSPINCRWYQDSDGVTQYHGERLLECAWDDRQEIILSLLSESAPGYPHADGTVSAIVRDIRPESRGAIGGTADLASYSRCILRVIYDTKGPRWVNGLYVNESMYPTIINVQTPGGLQWSDDSWVSKDEMSSVMSVVGWQHEITVGRATSAPPIATSYIGTVNASAKSCYYLPYYFASQTVKFGPPHVSSHTSYTTGTVYTYSYRHAINPFGWNKFWHSANQAWEYLYDADGNYYTQYPLGW